LSDRSKEKEKESMNENPIPLVGAGVRRPTHREYDKEAKMSNKPTLLMPMILIATLMMMIAKTSADALNVILIVLHPCRKR
jgi:hypothetical protein